MFDAKNFAIIKANRLFAGTAPKTKINISNKELLSAGSGTLIYKQNDDADSVYLVIQGEIKLEIKGIFKKPVIVTKTANDFFGEKEYLERVNRKGNAVASTDCQLCVLKKDKLDNLIAQDKRVFANLYGIIDDTAETEVRTSKESQTEEYLFGKPGDTTTGFEESTFEDESPEYLTPEPENKQEVKDVPASEPPQAESDEFSELKLSEMLDSDLPDFTEADIIKWAEEIETAVEPDKNLPDQKLAELKSEKEEISPDVSAKGNDNNDKDIRVEFDFLKELALLEDLPLAENKSKEVINFDLLDEDDILIGADEAAAPDVTLFVKDAVEDEIVKPDITAKDTDKKLPEAPAPEEEVKTPEFVEDFDELFVRRTDEIVEEIPDSEIIQSEDDLLKILPEEQPLPEIKEAAVPIPENGYSSKIPEVKEEHSDFKNELSEEVDEMTAAKFKQLLEAAQKINSSIKLDETLESILAAAKSLTGAERGYLYLVDRESNDLWAKALNNDIQKELRIKIGEDIPGICAEKGIVINLKDAYKDKRFNTDRDKGSGKKTKSLLCVPILNKTGFVSAVLQLTNSSNGEFTQSDEEALGALSVNISLALENAELMERQLQTDRVSSMGKMANFLIQDIKKPVLTIKYYAEHIKKKEVSSDVVQILDMLIDQSNAVVDLVQTTLSYSEGKGILRAQPLRLSTVLDDIFKLLAEYVESRHVNLFKKYESDAVVSIDKREFYQACFQIVKNACDAMPKGGDIYVLVKIEHGIVRIEFKDSGVGIPESIKSKIFEPFMSHGKKQGVGLGLSIAEKIIKDHSGEIKFESEIGEGTTFIISLPYISTA